MLATVVTVVGTHDLAKGVLVGVLLSGIFFAGKVAKLFHVRSSLSEDGTSAAIMSTARSSSPRRKLSSPPSTLLTT